MAQRRIVMRQGEERLISGTASLPSTAPPQDTLTLDGGAGNRVTLFGPNAVIAGYQDLPLTDAVLGPAREISAGLSFAAGVLPRGFYTLVFTLYAFDNEGNPKIFRPARTLQILAESDPAPDVLLLPDADALKTYLQSLGVFNPLKFDAACVLIDLEARAQSVAREWERRVCWHPFQSTGVLDEARDFDPPGPNITGFSRGGGRILRLHEGLLALRALSVHNGFHSTPQTLIENEDFVLSDGSGSYSRMAEGMPATRIEFLRAQSGAPRSLQIVGEWGFCRDIPSDVYDACLQYGAYLSVAQIRLNITRGLFAFKDLNTELRFASASNVPLAHEEKNWKLGFDAKVQGYMRPVVQSNE